MPEFLARTLVFCMLLGQALPVLAAEEARPLGQPSAGAPSVTEAWTRHGGARLYWNTLVLPRQMRMGGARFSDPAAVPELALTPPPAAEVKPVRRQSRHTVQAKKAAQAVPAPKGVGSTALKLPAPAAAPSKPVPPAAPPAVLPAEAKPLSAGAPPVGPAVSAGSADKGLAASPAPPAASLPYAAEKPSPVGNVRDEPPPVPSLPGASPVPAPATAKP